MLLARVFLVHLRLEVVKNRGVEYKVATLELIPQDPCFLLQVTLPAKRGAIEAQHTVGRVSGTAQLLAVGFQGSLTIGRARDKEGPLCMWRRDDELRTPTPTIHTHERTHAHTQRPIQCVAELDLGKNGGTFSTLQSGSSSSTRVLELRVRRDPQRRSSLGRGAY